MHSHPIDNVLARLRAVTGNEPAGNRQGWTAKCPAHEDRRASLSVAEGEDGRVLLKCHAGCTIEQICSSLSLAPADLFPSTSTVLPTEARNNQNRRHNNQGSASKSFPIGFDAVAELERLHGRRSAIWKYHDASGKIVGMIVRWDSPDGKKSIRPASLIDGVWRNVGMPEPRPLYGLPDLADATRVYVCEGEKAADAARTLGVTATTSAHGAASYAKTNWQPLAGKEVVILPDNDAPGSKFAAGVAAILKSLNPAAAVRIVELPGLPAGGDIVEWIANHGADASVESMQAELESLATAVAPVVDSQRPTGVDYFEPFPVSALPEPVSTFITAAATSIGCDDCYLALPMLAVLAAAIGNTRRLQLKPGWKVPAILWTVIVGESGSAKTPALKMVTRPVHERQRRLLEQYDEARKLHEAEQVRHERSMAEWKRSASIFDTPPKAPDTPRAERLIVSDTTVEALAPLLFFNPRGVLLVRDELAGWIGSFDRYSGGKGGADAAQWLSMHSGESIVVDRKTGEPRTIYVPSASVSICGGIQPPVLHRALGVQHRESGLAARLLLACPPRRAKRWTEAGIEPATEAEWAGILDRLYSLQSDLDDEGVLQPRVLELSEGARDAWRAFYNTHAREQIELDGDLAAAWSKLEESAARLALVVHLTRWAAGNRTLASMDIVDVESMAAGIQLATWFKREARRVYALLQESETERDLRRLADWIDRRGGSITARELQQDNRVYRRSADDANAALEELVKAGYGRWESSPPGQRGQPTRRYCSLRPPTVYGNSPAPEENTVTVDVDALRVGDGDSADEEWGEI